MRDEKQSPESGSAIAAKGAAVEIFDPPMCCSTGLCGPVQDPTLIGVDKMLRDLKNSQVIRLVREKLLSVLPITVVNGRVLKTGGSPLREDLEAGLKAGQA